MKTPIIDKKMYRSPMRNKTYYELLWSDLQDQTVQQRITVDAILAIELQETKCHSVKEIGIRLADSFNHINFGENVLLDCTVYPLNHWLTGTTIKSDKDTDFVPNTN